MLTNIWVMPSGIALYSALNTLNYKSLAIIVLFVLLLFMIRVVIELWKRNRQLRDQRDDEIYREMKRITEQQREYDNGVRQHLQEIVNKQVNRDVEMASIARQQDVLMNEQVRKEGVDRRVLVVCIGPDDPQLEKDIIAIRQSWEVGDYIRVTPLTRKRFASAVMRLRSGKRGSDRAVRYLHLAVHASIDGLVFADGVVDAGFLSEYLHDLDCILINGCNSDIVGDHLIGLARYVVSLSDEIRHEDATALCRSFWAYIKDGWPPDDAFYESIRDVPKSTAEFAVLHSNES